jgi:hypothetical protein
VVQLDYNVTNTHSNGMSQFPFLMNNQSLVGHKNAVCFSNQDNNFQAGNPDDIKLNDDSKIVILLGDMLNSTQDQDNDGHSQLDTPTLSQLSNRNSSILHHPSIHPIIEASKPFNLDARLPSCFIFQMELAIEQT